MSKEPSALDEISTERDIPLSEALDAISGARLESSHEEMFPDRAIPEVMINPRAVAPECKAIDGDHGYSSDARYYYSSNRPDIFLLGKAVQSFECGKHKGAVYYYRFHPYSDMEERKMVAQVVIRDPGRPHRLYSRHIFTIDNVMIVVSIKKSKVLFAQFAQDAPG